MFRLRKESNYDLLHWSLFLACAFTITLKTMEITSNKSMEIFAYHPDLAQYSTFVQLFS